MNNNILNYLIVFIIISYLIYKDIKSDKKVEKIMSLSKVPKKIVRTGIEITKLKKILPIIFFEYKTTFNHIINDGRKVYINTLRALNNRLIYEGHRFNLSSIEFHLGSTTFNNKKIQLEMHMVNNSTVNDTTIRIIVPLNLVDVYESFKAINSFEIPENNTIRDNNHINIINSNDIPFYMCCSPNKGKLKRIYFKFINCFLNKAKKYYMYKPNSQIIWFYTKPKKFSKITGKKILESLQK